MKLNDAEIKRRIERHKEKAANIKAKVILVRGPGLPEGKGPE